LWTFLNPKGSATSQIVVTQGSDGYEVVLSLAEIDPALGDNPVTCYLMPTPPPIFPPTASRAPSSRPTTDMAAGNPICGLSTCSLCPNQDRLRCSDLQFP